MAIITFTSDFGLRDHYVASVKAKIFNYNPNIQVIDISHQVESFDIGHAAYILNAVYRDFPKGTVHLVGLNIKEEKENKLIAARIEDHFFVGADNGLFSLLSEKMPMVVEILSDKMSETTFPEKNILAFAAVSLASGKGLYDLGPQVNNNDIKKYSHRRLKITKNTIEGSVIHIDHYGNAITNITKKIFNENQGERKFEVRIGVNTFSQINNYYYDVPNGDVAIFFNDNGYLEIAIKQGKANSLLGLRYDGYVGVEFFEN